MIDCEGACVLVIDDDASLRAAAERLFVHAGFHVRGAANARDAIASLRRDTPPASAAVVDLELGRDDGLALVRHLRVRRPRIGIVVFSACVDEATRAALLALGVSAVIPKPTPPETLLAAVRKAILPALSV
jgi:DNA-binding response OmpR family regulator